jgi:cytoskeletal protein CcmA (bactofilin family)
MRTTVTAATTSSPAGVSKCWLTTIGEHTRIVGDLIAREDLNILGEVHGRILCNGNVTVSVGARILASVDASSIVIIGDVQGAVKADKIDIRKTARLVGDIRCARVVIEDGAYFKGSIDISKSVRPKPKLALQGSREAEELDRIAESDIEAGRFATLSDDLNLEQLFSLESPALVPQTFGETVSKSF